MSAENMLMTMAECREKFGGVSRIKEMIRVGSLHRVAYGIYSDGACHRDVEILQKRYPASVVTLQSAYYYYDLSDSVPEKIHLSVERGSSQIDDPNVVECFVPKGTGGIGVENVTLRDTPLRIFDKERLLIETIRLRTKIPYELYREVIGNYRQIANALYFAQVEDYLESFPKRKLIFDIIKKEVL
jgi:hypothetical protein